MSELSHYIDELAALQCVLLHVDTARNIAREVFDAFAPRIAEIEKRIAEKPTDSLADYHRRNLAAETAMRDRIIARISALFCAEPTAFVAIGAVVHTPPENPAEHATRFMRMRDAVRNALRRKASGERP